MGCKPSKAKADASVVPVVDEPQINDESNKQLNQETADPINDGEIGDNNALVDIESVSDAMNNALVDIESVSDENDEKHQVTKVEAQQQEEKEEEKADSTPTPPFSDDDFPDVTLTEADFPLPDGAQETELMAGIKYKGGWLNGEQHGHGQMTFPDQGSYIGEFKNGRASGKGIFTSKNGSKYIGDFLDSRADGYGKYMFPDGAIHWGMFKQDIRTGPGKEVLSDGTTYIGGFENGSKSGYGFLSFGGEKYMGQFKTGDINGFGQYTWADNRRYVGYWDRSKQHGLSLFYWPEPNAKIFAGRYRDGKIGGFGTLWWADGRIYMGNWSNGMQNGDGVYYLDKHRKRKANFLEGVRTRWLGEEISVEWENETIPLKVGDGPQIVNVEDLLPNKANIDKIEDILAEAKGIVDGLPTGAGTALNI